jgi:hypothetical protein
MSGELDKLDDNLKNDNFIWQTYYVIYFIDLREEQ